MRKNYKTQEEWLHIRKGLIDEGRLGGSMIGTAAGVNPYKSAARLWGEMKGLIEEPDISGREAVRDGRDHEDYVAQRFCEATGKSVHRENCIFTNEKYPHLFASIDRKVSGEEAGLECKTANAFRLNDFTDTEFPKSYYAQVCSYLAVTGLKRWYLCVWCMGVYVKIYLLTTDRDDLAAVPEWCCGAFFVSQEELEACEAIAADFIAALGCDKPPHFDGSEDETEALKELYPDSNGEAIKLDETIELLLAERDAKKQAIAELEAGISAAENELRAYLGEYETARGASWRVSNKTQTSRRLNAERIKEACGGVVPAEYYAENSTRVLRISKIKKNDSVN